MKHPFSTGRAAREIGSTEPRLNDLVRRGKIDPCPEVVAGRRLWSAHHRLQAAEALGLLTATLRAQLESEIAQEEVNLSRPGSGLPQPDDGGVDH